MSQLQMWEVRGFDNAMQFEGTLLGYASSKRSNHSAHDEECAPAGVRCSACRWFEVRIFRTTEQEYVVEMTGQTLVDGEKTRHRAEVTQSPYWVIDVLTQRDNDRTFIPLVSKRALAEAAVHDLELKDAYITRTVA